MKNFFETIKKGYDNNCDEQGMPNSFLLFMAIGVSIICTIAFTFYFLGSPWLMLIPILTIVFLYNSGKE